MLSLVVEEALAPLARLGVVVKEPPASSSGVEITEVLSGGPAAKAGLRRGDTITELAHQAVTSVDRLGGLLVEQHTSVTHVRYFDPAGRHHTAAVKVAREPFFLRT
jgi:S1-C subfamily serine protease